MKKIILSILLVTLCCCLWGCATATSTSGRDFDSSKVSRVVKGTTTADEISTWFGRPTTKQPEINNTERWIYSYATATARADGWPGFGIHTHITEGHKKILNLLLNKEKVVVNFTFDDGPIEPIDTTTHTF